MSFKEFVNQLATIINYNSLYIKIQDKKKSDLKKILKKAFENKRKNQRFECDELKIKKILNVFKKLKNINISFVEEICKYLDEKDLEDIKEIEILPKENVINEKTLKRLKTLTNNNITNLKNANKPYFSAFLLKELLRLLMLLNNADERKLKKALNDNSLSLEKLKVFNDNLNWIINKPQILTIIASIPLKTLLKLKEELKNK